MSTTIEKERVFNLSDIIRNYIYTALWSTINEEENEEDFLKSYSVDDVDTQSFNNISLDCEKFLNKNRLLLIESGLSDEQIGHDFWLTRAGHGAGFWDRDLGEVGKKLTEAAKKFKPIDQLFVLDGKIRFE